MQQKKEVEKLDNKATLAKLVATGRTVAGWARSKGIDPERMRNVFRGRFRPKDEELQALRDDGLLVENGGNA